MIEYFLIAKILSADSKGSLKIVSFSDFPERFFELKTVYIDFFGDKKLFKVEKVFKQKNNFYLKFENFNNKKDVEILLGKEIFVDEKQLKKLPDNFYYIHDLINSRVYLKEKLIGTIVDVLSLPANDVYVVKAQDGSEILIPAIGQFIEKFVPQEKKLFLKDLPVFDDDEG